MYDSRHRPRPVLRQRRANPLAAIAGLAIMALAVGGLFVGAQALLGGALAAGPPGTTSTPDPIAASVGTAVPEALPTRATGPRATLAPAADPTVAPSADAAGQAGVGAVEQTATPKPTRTPRPWAHLRPRPRRGPFSMDLYKPGAMASQSESIYCVPAAMLTMINIMKKGRPDTSASEQDRLYFLARKLSTDKLTGTGAEPEGWARGLEREGFGQWAVHMEGGRRLAVNEAARAIRFTGRPVGLLAWRGAHAWVMTGFRATADPAFTRDFEVTHVVIADVWYPRVSTIWGASNPPGTLVDVDRLGEDILDWYRPGVRYADKDGKIVMVIPVLKDGSYDPTRR